MDADQQTETATHSADYGTPEPPSTAGDMGHLWRSWPAHNLIAHPVSEVLHWVGLGSLGNRLHDATLPAHVKGEGRG